MPLRSRTVRALRALALLLPALAAAAHAPAQQRPRTASIPPVQPRYVPAPNPQPVPADTTGLRFRLSEGRAGSGPGAQRPRATAGTPLSAGETERLLSRLPALRADSSAADSFVFPPQSAPPPRTGPLVRASFPAPDAAGRPAAPAAGALEVVRRGPEGAVETGAGVTVVFSQPMVPLSSVSEVAARDVPVTLTPQPRGRWRWLDVRTLVFEPEGRMPAATRYTVEVAPRARSALGAVLAAPVRWSFATPAPRATGGYPQGMPATRDPLILLTWDQAVDPAAVLPHVRVRAGGTAHRLRLATPAEVAADERATALLRGHEPGRWTAFRLVSPLPGDAQVRVSVEPGAPSAEGPLRTETVQEWSFRTYGPLRVTEQACGYGSECRPGWPWRIELSNPLDTGAWHDSLVSVEPALPGLEVEVYGNVVMITGRARPMTTYRVTLHPSIRDQFGQTLGRTGPRVFRVGAPSGRLWSAGETLLVLDPAGPRRVSVFSHDLERLRLRVLRVRPEDYPAFAAAVGRGRGRGAAPALPGQAVVSRVVTPGVEPGTAAEIGVDLAPALTDGLGHAIVAVEPASPRNDEERGQAVYLWVQSTRIGLTALADDRSLVTWATSLVDGAPLPGAVLTLGGAERATTRADGLATLPLPGSSPSEGGVLVARLGSDVAFLPERAGRGGWGGWQRQTVRDGLGWYVATDRNLYRPGEQVRFKGWVRRLVRGDDGGPALLRGADSLRYTVRDGEGNEIGAGVVRLTPLGGFDGAFTLPAGTRLGSASIQLRGPAVEGVGNVEHQAQFEVQEFRRPEFEVTVTADGGPYRVGGSAELTARAGYYSGGGLPGAEVKWSVSATPTRFTPAGWDRWTFGDAGGPRYYGRGPRGASVERSLEGRTDASGTHVLRLDFDRADPPLPSSVRAQATVLDVNRQSWTAGTQLLVHASDLYVGLRLGRFWTEPGKPLEVEVVVVDAAGKPVAGREVEVRGGPGVGEWEGGEWRADSTAQVCRLVSADAPLRCTFTPERGGRWLVAAAVRDAAGRPSWTQAGIWVSGGVVERPDPPLLGEARQVELIADREQYRPGETAEVLLRAPFFPARGLLTVTRPGIVRTEEFTVGGATHVLRVPITERDVPDVTLRVELVGARGGADSAGTRGTDFASGSLALSVPARSRTLTVTATPRDTLMEPDARTVVELEVRDAEGRPAAGAEVALVVVDEAVLALTGYRHPNPADAFYPARGDATRVNANRPHVLLAPEDFRPAPGTLVGTVADARTGQPLGGASVTLRGTGSRATTDAAGRFRLTGVEAGEHTLRVERAEYTPLEQTVRVGAEAHPPLRLALVGEPRLEALYGARVPGVAVTANADFAGKAANAELRQAAPTSAPLPPPPPPAVGAAAPGAPIALRTDFNALAHFSPAVRTDADGRARVEIAIPSNLTRYRVVALAVAGERLFGLGESAVTARRTLMVRPSPPRFLNLGDRFELPVVVQNQGSSALEVQVAVRGSGLDLPPTGRSVLVPAGDRVEVRFPAAADRAGMARFQVAVSGGALTDAAEQSLPVWTPATAEAFATYGAVDSGAVVLPVQVPAAVLPGFGGLEVTTSSTALQELTDAVLYLVRYPYGCTEQIASRVVSVAALRDVLTAFRAEGMPSPDSLRASVGRDVAALARLQNDDGGWGFWSRGEPSWPFVSVHVAHALQRAREKGFTVPDGVMQRALAYLRQVERHTPRTYSARTRNAVAAYALYVRGRARDGAVPAEARRLLARAGSDSLTLEARGWLLATLAGAPGAQAAVDTLARQILNRATETAATATFATSYGEEEYLILHSARRTDAVLLDALIAAQPRSDLIPKVVRGLLGHRRKGRWESTQENAWVLLALDRYFAAYEGATPDFVARAWLGERYVGGHEFRGRTTERAHVAVPMRVLAEGGDSTTLTVAKEGAGRMYYRAGLRYAPASLDLAASVQGFAVERAYEAVDDSADVRRDADGSWRVRAGARVRVRLTMTAPSRRHHVALADPLPAGFEALNPELAGSQTGDRAAQEADKRPAWGWTWRWWEHQNLRDERAEAFTSLLPAGTYTYTYLARATTPGSFVVPPARAEEMYHPETFGRTATARVRVEDAPSP